MFLYDFQLEIPRGNKVPVKEHEFIENQKGLRKMAIDVIDYHFSFATILTSQSYSYSSFSNNFNLS